MKNNTLRRYVKWGYVKLTEQSYKNSDLARCRPDIESRELCGVEDEKIDGADVG